MSEEYERLLMRKEEIKRAKRKKLIIGLCALAFVVAAATAAGIYIYSSNKTVTEVADTEEGAEAKPDVQQALLNIAKGNASETDYYTVADFYQENQNFVKERDTLEECFGVYKDDESKDRLASIIVDAQDDTAAVQYVTESLGYDLELTEEFPELLHLVQEDMFSASLSSPNGITTRNYNVKMDGGQKLYLNISYGENGTASKIIYQDSAGIKEISYQDSIAEILDISQTDTVTADVFLNVINQDNSFFNGEYSAIVLDGAGGSITKLAGTLADGNATGEITINYYQDKIACDVYDLYAGIDNYRYTSMTGQTTGLEMDTLLSMTNDERTAMFSPEDTKTESETKASSTTKSTTAKSQTTAGNAKTTGNPATNTTQATVSTNTAANAAASTPASSGSSGSAGSSGSSGGSSSSATAASTPAASTPASSTPASTPAASTPASTPSTPASSDSGSSSSDSSSGDTDSEWTTDLL